MTVFGNEETGPMDLEQEIDQFRPVTFCMVPFESGGTQFGETPSFEFASKVILA